MSSARCAALWMVEAARVGQLAPAQALQLREHMLSGCDACRREARYLAWLGETLLAHEPSGDEVAIRRLRRTTLQHAHDRVYRAPRVGSHRQRLLLAGALALAAAAVGWHGFGRTPEIVVTPLTAAAPVQRLSERDREIVVLGDGVYELSVRRRIFDRQVIVRVPEGEIHDVGTVFGVSVQQGRTERVAVSQGAVVLRLHGVPEVRLDAGKVWQAPQLELETVPMTVLPELEPAGAGSDKHATPGPHPDSEPAVVQSETLYRQRARQPAKALGSSRSSRVSHSSHSSHSSHVSEPGGADPESAGEDATYLRVLDLLRQQRRADAQRLAELYLERFPRGFRRPEIERIAREHPVSE